MKAVRVIGFFLALMPLAVALVIGVNLHREGYRAFIIHTGSMTGTMNSGGLVIDRPLTKPLHVGEVITFRHSGLTTDLVTHRIVGLAGGTIQTKGDANQVRDTWNIRHDQVRGVVTTYLPDMGYVAFCLRTRAGIAAVMTGALSVVFLWGLFFETGGEPSTRRRAVNDAVPAV